MLPKPRNFVYQKISATDGKLVLIDNIGNSDLVPLCNYIGFLAVWKIRRKWKRFESLLVETYPQNTALRKILSAPKP